MSEVKIGTLLRAAFRACEIGGNATDAISQACEEVGLDPTQTIGGAAAVGSTSGVPRDLEKLKAVVAEGEWNRMPFGRAKKFRVDRDGNPARPGYCQGSKTGSCGDDFPSLDTPYVYRKQDQPGGAATVCAACFDAAGGVEKPYVPKNSPQPTPSDSTSTQSQLGYDEDEKETVPF